MPRGKPFGKCENIPHGAIVGAPPIAGENSITGHPIAGAKLKKMIFSRALGQARAKTVIYFRIAVTAVKSLVRIKRINLMLTIPWH